MPRRERLFRLIAWITFRHLRHYQAQVTWINALGARLMQWAAPDVFDHAQQAMSQQQELLELRVLSGFYEVARMARHAGGWQDRHGGPLDNIANILVQQHEWEPEEVGTFVEALTEGAFVYHGGEFDDDDD